ncbi:hypothetical protein D3C81_1829760 [compost metagenome]
MIRTLPGADLRLVRQRLKGLVYAPVPFAKLVINNIFIGKSPGGPGSVQEPQIIGQLIGVVETYNSFSLWPPISCFVYQTLAVSLVPYSAIAGDPLGKNGLRHGDGHSAYPLEQFLISKRLSGFNQQPAAFDIMTVGDSL